MTHPNKLIPYLALCAGILCLSLSSFFIHWSEAPGIVTSFYRLSIAAIFLLPFLLWNIIKRKQIVSKWLLFPLAAGIFNAFDHASWSTSVNMTQIANATLINNIAPLWVALFAGIFLREKLKFGFWIGLLCTLLGAAVVLGNDLINHPTLGMGDLLALLSSLFYAGYYILTQIGRRKINTISYISLACLSGGLTLFGIAGVQKMPIGGYSQATYLVFLGAALISQVCGYFSMAYALGHLPASVVSPTMIAQPVLTALMAIPIAGQPLSIPQVFGGLVVLAGIFLVNKHQEEKEKESI